MVRRYIKATGGALYLILHKDEARKLLEEGKIQVHNLNKATVLQSGEDLDQCIEKDHTIGVDQIKYYLLKNNLLNK